MRLNGDDTICAPATAPGQGAIGIVRVSGPLAIMLVDRHFRATSRKPLAKADSHTVHHGRLIDPHSPPPQTIDEVLVMLMRAPNSYTTEDVVEVQCHGGGVAVERVIAALVGNGCRLAEPGEFTRRAFLGGRIDLAQAEAVMEVIESRTAQHQRVAQRQLEGALSEPVRAIIEPLRDLTAQVEAAIDFPDEEVTIELPPDTVEQLRRFGEQLDDILNKSRAGHLLRDGVRLAIVGQPNVGKSRLLNRLVGSDRAIVSDTAGTTRDVVAAEMAIDGIRFEVQDTAGLRQPSDTIEAEGIARSHQAARTADLIVKVLDGSCPLDDGDRAVLADYAEVPAVVVISKGDLPQTLQLPDGMIGVTVSALEDTGLDALRAAMVDAVRGQGAPPLSHSFVTSVRQTQAIEQAFVSLAQAAEGVEQGQFAELIATDLRTALDALGEITGETTSDDLLNRIFERFCIGK